VTVVLRSQTPNPEPIPDPFNPEPSTLNARINIGARVAVVLKEDQRSGRQTEGEVLRLLTNARYHPRGIKVQSLRCRVG
jgi:uncharacterized repeat protein (TIGR03833 family)